MLYRVMSREDRLRNLILDNYISLRKFSIAANIPYSTLMTLLQRGIGGASFDTMLQICKTLKIDPYEI